MKEEEKINIEVDSEKDETSILDVLKDSIRIFWEITRLALRFWFLLPIFPFLLELMDICLYESSPTYILFFLEIFQIRI